MININIRTDRGSNFIKAFAPYEPLYCFGHCINNVLKVCFFHQQQNKIKQKFQSLSDNISLETQATLTNASLNVRADDLSSSPDLIAQNRNKKKSKNEINQIKVPRLLHQN